MTRRANGRDSAGTLSAMRHSSAWKMRAIWAYPAEIKAAHNRIAELEAIVDDRDRELASIHRKHRTDNLTGVLNRNGLDEVIEDLSADAHLPSHSDRKACILVLDLDKFKDVNETHGHDAGDQLLEQVFSEIGKIEVSSGVLHFARTGGDEGVGIFYDMRSKRAIAKDHRKQDRRKRAEASSNGGRKDRRSGKLRERIDMTFEEYAIGVVRKKLQEIADMEFEVDSKLGYKVKVKVGISDGYAIVTDLSKAGIRAGINEADVQASDRKYGIIDFNEAYKGSETVREYFASLPGFEEGQPMPSVFTSTVDSKKSAIEYIIQNDPDFRQVLPHLNDRALHYIFPALKGQRSDAQPVREL